MMKQDYEDIMYLMNPNVQYNWGINTKKYKILYKIISCFEKRNILLLGMMGWGRV